MSGCRRCFAPSLLLIAATIGCGPKFGLPRIWPPLPESYQVGEAKKFDPFPDPTIAPTIVGGRPLDYANPRPDPDAAKMPPPPLIYPGTAVSYPPPPTYYPPASRWIAPPPTTQAPFAPAVTYPPAAVYPAPPATSIGPAVAPVAYGTKISSP